MQGTDKRLSPLARLRVGTKLLLLVLVPVCVLVIVAVLSGVDDQRRATELRHFRSAARVSFATAGLAQALAEERAATAVLHLQPTTQAQIELTAARRSADDALRQTAASSANSPGPVDVAGRLDGARRQLQALRLQVDGGSLPLPAVTESYGVMVRDLLGTVGLLVAGRPTQATGRSADAYVALLQAIEAADRERVDMAAVLSAPPQDRLLMTITGRALETAELDTFRQMASGNLRAALNASLLSPSGIKVQQVRSDILTNPSHALTEISLQEWLDASGRRLQDLRHLQQSASDEALAAATHDLDAARAAGLRDLVLSLVVLVAVTGLGLALRRSIARPLREISDSARMLSRGDLDVDISYAGRDEIGAVATAFRDLHVTAMRMTDEIRAMNVAIVDNRLDHRADESAFEGRWSLLLVGMNDTIAAFAQAQDQRQQAERQLADIFNLSLDLLCIAGVDGYLKRVNPAFEATLGYSSEELLSKPLLDFVHPDDRTPTSEALDLALDSEIVQFENRYLRRDGSECWLQWNSRPAPRHGLLVAAARDITDSRRAREEQAALRRVATLVAKGVPSVEVFDAVVAETREFLNADLTKLIRYEVDGNAQVVAARSGPHLQPLAETRLELAGQSVAAAVLRSGQVARMETFEGAPASVAALAELDIRTRVGAPIVVEGQVWGAIVAGWRTEERVSSDTEGRMTEFTELVATAIANADSRSQLAASRARVVAAADETRRRIERDLHDGVQQRLVTLGLQIRAAQDAVPDELAEIADGLSSAQRSLTGALDDLRDISRGIHPAILSQRGGLVAAMRTLARRSAVPVELDIDANLRLPDHIEIAAYFVVAETLTNVAKHAQASLVRLELAAHEATVELAIRDDGIGGADPRRGSGLIGLTDRVEAIGGTISITSPTGGGTTVLVAFPMAETADSTQGTDVS